jgi:hypothetical protein
MHIDEKAPGNISQQGVTNSTDNETGHVPARNRTETAPPAQDKEPGEDAAAEEDMADVEAADSVSSEHPAP